MKIKRFFAPDIRCAMRMVKDELGADAVIMSNRSVDNGVEIIAARDFDEQLIHEDIKQQASVGRKKVSLTDAKPVQSDVHILTSKRKRQADGSVPKLADRKNSDQYIGYAEKVALNSAKREIAALRTNNPVLSKPQKKQLSNQQQVALDVTAPKTSKQPILENSALNGGVLQEMRKEIKQLKTLFEHKFSAVGGSQDTKYNPVRIDLLRRLADIGVSKKLGIKIANRLGSHTDAQLAWKKAQEMLMTMFPVAQDTLLDTGGIVAVVGPTGVGKTTTIAKLAAQYILQHGSRQVALISTDNFRISAHEQLKTYGRILDVPVSIAAKSDELRDLIKSYSDKRLILIDTAGMSQRDMRLADQIDILQQSDIPIKSYLVISATTQYKSMNEIIDAFKVFNPVAGIVTKMDEAALKGAVLSTLIERQMPLAYITDGQQVPQDIHVANAATMVAACVHELDLENNNNDVQNYDDLIAAGYA